MVNATPNLGIFSIRKPDENRQLSVGSFYRRLTRDQDVYEPTESTIGTKRLAIMTEDSGKASAYPVGSQAESVVISTSQPNGETSTIGSPQQDDKQSNPDIHSAKTPQETPIIPNLLIDTQTTSKTDESTESFTVNLNPDDYVFPESESRSELGSGSPDTNSGAFTIRGENVPKCVTKKTYPKQRPYDKIMSGVIFVLSGYSNPRRGKIRDMALAMGAKYSPNWNKTCTHLICAFKNTPKYKEVMNEKGRIVREHWIKYCSIRKELLDWRDYKLGKYSYPDSEEEGVDDLDYALERSYGIEQQTSEN